MCFSTAGGTRQEAFLQTDSLSASAPETAPGSNAGAFGNFSSRQGKQRSPGL